MIEKVQINSKDVWILIEPHAIKAPEEESQEYFSATYYLKDSESNGDGSLVLDSRWL